MNTTRGTIWIAITLLFTTCMCLLQGISVQWGGAEKTLGIAFLLLAAAYLFRTSRVRIVFQAVGLWTCFIFVFVYALRAVATTARPYADPLLATIDMGVAVEVYRWAKYFPRVDAVLSVIYNSTYLQTEIALVYLAVTNQKARMGTLLLRFILAALLTLIGFYWLPARGTVYCGLPVPDGYGDILVELARLRDGVTTIGGPQTTALITFPSFHTVSAVLLISVYHRSCMFRPVLVLNGLMILSCLTIGMHYAVDILAGLAICGVVIASTRLTIAPEQQTQPSAGDTGCVGGAGDLAQAGPTLPDAGIDFGDSHDEADGLAETARTPSGILSA